MFEKQNLFEARQNGYWIYRIPSLAVTKNNVVLATCEARPGRGGDYDFNDILMRRSTDGGKTFGPVVKLVDHTTYGAGPASNMVMIPDTETGRLTAVFCHDYARVFTMHSDDDGATFSDPEEITGVFEEFRADYPWRVCATGPGHGLQLRNGRMIIPVWLSDGSGTEMAGHRGHRPSLVTLIYSDDRGLSWKRGAIVCRHGDPLAGETLVNPSETLAVELTDGRVLFNMRSESRNHRRLTAVSPDGVSGWSGFRWEEALLEPICMAALERLNWPTKDNPGRLIFVNPDTLERTLTTWACDRKRVTVKLSEDDGRTWCASRVLEEGPSGYSDLGVLPGGECLCLYENGMVEHMCDTRFLTLARFDINWIQKENKGK